MAELYNRTIEVYQCSTGLFLCVCVCVCVCVCTYVCIRMCVCVYVIYTQYRYSPCVTIINYDYA